MRAHHTWEGVIVEGVINSTARRLEKVEHMKKATGVTRLNECCRRLTPLGSASLDEALWLRAIEACTGEVFVANFQPYECKSILNVLAAERAKVQLLPALRIIKKEAAMASSLGLTARQSLAERTDRLLSILKPQRLSEPSIKVDFPKPGGRVSGRVIPFVADIFLGSRLEERLGVGLSESSASFGSDEEALNQAGGQRQPSPRRTTPVLSSDLEGGDGARRRDGGEMRSPREASTLERCELRVVVDGSEVQAIDVPLASYVHLTQALSIEYAPRCSEHPAQNTVGAMRGDRWWDHDNDAWYLEARTIDGVCTGDMFGSHSMRAELACCQEKKSDYTNAAAAVVTGVDGVEQPPTDAAGADMRAKSPPRSCEIFASTPSVEYFHTANGVPEARASTASNGDSARSPSPSDLPPDSISVSLYVENAASTATMGTVTVPIWSSDGEVWEVRYKFPALFFLGCSKIHGAHTLDGGGWLLEHSYPLLLFQSPLAYEALGVFFPGR